MPWKTRLKERALVRAVVGIVQRDERILVGQRPLGKPYSGYWEFPGGKIEPQESGHQALKRELHEELGIDVVSAKLWFEHTHAYPEKDVVLEVWLVEKFTGEPQSQENQSLCWATLSEIRNLKVLEGNWLILEKLAVRELK